MKNLSNKVLWKKTFVVLLTFTAFLIGPTITAQNSHLSNQSELSASNGQKKINSAYDLLIITPMEFAKELQPLVNHKNRVGISTKLVTLPEIYNQANLQGRDCAEKIKYYIKNASEEWEIKYVLLIGGVKNQFSKDEKWWLPVRYSYLEDRWGALPIYEEEKFLSDLYYADIYDENGDFCSWDDDGDGIFGEWYDNKTAEDKLDLHPDVYVGRLPCQNFFEVRIMVNKIINYEKKKCSDTWFKNMVVVAGDTYLNNDFYEGEVETQLALDQMPDFKHIKLWTSLNTLTGEKDVVKAINNGCGFIYLEGHGSPNTWGTHPPNSKEFIYGLDFSSMTMLFNWKKLPVCIVGGCHNSMFNVSLGHTSWSGPRLTECWSWRLTHKIAGGSIATIGNTALGYGAGDKLDPSQGGAGGHLNMCFFEEYGQNHTEILGECWGKAIDLFLQDIPIDWNANSYEDTTIDVKTLEEWILFGDPSLKIGGYS
jgi:hypothetical protein